MIHPSKDVLEAFADNNLTPESATIQIRAHLEVCEFCSDFVDEYRAHEGAVRAIMDSSDSEDLTKFLREFEYPKLFGLTIELLPLKMAQKPPRNQLAADSSAVPQPESLSIATLYSENPEIVMKLMRDQHDGSKYIQLIAESANFIKNVLVCAPESGMQVVTDSEGKAVIDSDLPEDPASLRWQICLPEATFDLEPLVYDPEKVEYSQGTVLETDRGDRVRLTITGKTVGKQIEVELLQLDGQSDFAAVKIVLIEGSHRLMQDATLGQRILFTLPENTSNINLRIFQ